MKYLVVHWKRLQKEFFENKMESQWNDSFQTTALEYSKWGILPAIRYPIDRKSEIHEISVHFKHTWEKYRYWYVDIDQPLITRQE